LASVFPVVELVGRDEELGAVDELNRGSGVVERLADCVGVCRGTLYPHGISFHGFVEAFSEGRRFDITYLDASVTEFVAVVSHRGEYEGEFLWMVLVPLGEPPRFYHEYAVGVERKSGKLVTEDEEHTYVFDARRNKDGQSFCEPASVTSMVEPADWSHVTKVDPDKGMSEEKARRVAGTGTDAVVVGGTQGVTREKVLSLLSALEKEGVPVVVEPSNPASVVHTGNGLLVPTVLNSGKVDWVVGIQKEWARIDEDIDWSRVFAEGYVVMNPESAVGRLTDAKTDISPEEAAAYATVADRFFDLPVVYVEYSGTFGEMCVVEEVADAVGDATVFYGGGVNSYERAHEAAEHADCVVVGDAAHQKGVETLRETVRGVRDARGQRT